MLNCQSPIPHYGLGRTNHDPVVSDRQPSSLEGRLPLALIEDPQVRESLRRIVIGFSQNPVVQEELLQESLIHLWRVGKSKPGQTKSWYLQSCRFYVQHWLAAGRSLDSPKRAHANKRIALNQDDSDMVLAEYHTNGELFETVSFRDLICTLSKHLKPRERVVLNGLAEGLSASEIASGWGISRPTVGKDRRRLAALTIKLGISQRRSIASLDRRSEN